jgi:lambda repressor-like predicted transcriptional regulator
MQNSEVDIGELILQRLKEKERTLAWLAKKVGCDDSNLRKTLKNSRYLYFDLIFRISIALEEDFFAYCSQKLKDTNSR